MAASFTTSTVIDEKKKDRPSTSALPILHSRHDSDVADGSSRTSVMAQAKEISSAASTACGKLCDSREVKFMDSLWVSEAEHVIKSSKALVDLLTQYSRFHQNPMKDTKNANDLHVFHRAFLNVTQWILHLIPPLTFSSDILSQYNNLTDEMKLFPTKLVETAIKLAELAEQHSMPLHLPLYASLSLACASYSSDSQRDILTTSMSLKRAHPQKPDAAVWDSFLEPALSSLSERKQHKEVVEVLSMMKHIHGYDIGCTQAYHLLKILETNLKRDLNDHDDNDARNLMDSDAIDLFEILRTPLELKVMMDEQRAEDHANDVRRFLSTIRDYMNEEEEAEEENDDFESELDDYLEEDDYEEEEEGYDYDEKASSREMIRESLQEAIEEVLENDSGLENKIRKFNEVSKKNSDEGDKLNITVNLSINLPTSTQSPAAVNDPEPNKNDNSLSSDFHKQYANVFDQKGRKGKHDISDRKFWNLPDVTPQFWDWNNGEDLHFTSEYERKLDQNWEDEEDDDSEFDDELDSDHDDK